MCSKGTGGCLCLGVNTIAHRSALHENDGMMSVFSRHGGRQAQDVFCLRATDNLLETRSRQVMALVHDDLSILPHAIVDRAFPNQALDNCNIEQAGRPFAVRRRSSQCFSAASREMSANRSTHCSNNCRRWTSTSVLTRRWAIIQAATTVFPKAVVAARMPVS